MVENILGEIIDGFVVEVILFCQIHIQLFIIYLKEQVTAFSTVLRIQYVNSIPCIKIEYMY